MNKIAIFGAGSQGRSAAAVYKKEGVQVCCFVDNSTEKQGSIVHEIPVVSIEDYIKYYSECDIVICCMPCFQRDIIDLLNKNGVLNYSLFKKEKILSRERIISYSYPTENEDIILSYVLRGVPANDIRWIDVGSNDPQIGSVTQLFYELGGKGINIDVEESLIEISKKIRSRDINLWSAVGNGEGSIIIYSQGDYGGLSTAVESNVDDEVSCSFSVPLTTLKSICDIYVDFQLTFLKIDVEGMEKDVLQGMDFIHYRPWILIIESTLPQTMTYNYEEWEPIVISSGYHHVYSHGVNRYYVADEKCELDERFIPWEDMASCYCILHPDILYAI